MREELARYQSSQPCETCHGARLRPEPLSVKIAGEDISLSSRRSVADAFAWFGALEAKLDPAAARNRPRHPQGNQRAPRLPPQCRARLPQPRPHQRHACRGGESQRIRLAIADRQRPVGRPLRPRRALDRPPPEGQRPPARNPQAPASRSATPCWWSSMTRTRSATPTMSSTWAPAPASTAAKWSARARSSDLLACKGSLTADYLTGRREIPLPPEPPQGHRARPSPSTAPRANNLANVTVDFPARHLHLRHRRLGLGQVVADHRHALRRRRAHPQRRAHPRRRARQGHRPRASRQGHRHRPVADRPHPALQPRDLHRRLHPDPRLVRRPARKQGARLQARPLLASTSRAAAARRARATAC